jgi:outer membrane protein TolC
VKSRIAYFVTIAGLMPSLAAAQVNPVSSGESTFAPRVGQTRASETSPEGGGERLSLDSAVRMALENNRTLQTAKLEMQKADDEVEVARTHRLPSFQTSVQSSYLLTPVNFSFPRGAFGDFAGIGPIPATDTEITTPRRPNIYVSSQVTQPISQLFQIGLSIRGAAKARDIDRESVRAQELAVTNSVKRLYFAMVQTTSALTAEQEAIALYKELDRTLQVQVLQKVALRGDALDVQSKLAQEELTRLTHQHALETQKEQLNQLLGRDVRTAFDIEAPSAIAPTEVSLESAHQQALTSRPDVRQARLRLEQADLDRRLKKADRIPEISVGVSYISNFNMDILPTNLATVGVQVKWEPFDWGRKGRELSAKARSVEQARLAVRDAEDRAVLEINSQFRKLAEARAQLDVAAATQRAARERLRVKTNQYQIQAAMLSDVLRLRADLASSDDRYQQALTTFWTAKADFEQAIGEEGSK